MFSFKGSRTVTVLKPQDTKAINIDAVLRKSFNSAERDPGSAPYSGCVSVRDALNCDPGPDSGIGACLAFAVRTDQKKLQASAVKLALAEAVAEKKAEGVNLGRKAKRDLKEIIEQKMLATTPYSFAVTDVVWHPGVEELWVFEGPGKRLQSVIEFLADMFGTGFVQNSVDSLEAMLTSVLTTSQDSNGWHVSEYGNCVMTSPTADGDGELGSAIFSNAPDLARHALAEGWTVAKLTMQAESEQGLQAVFTPMLEPDGKGWCLKGLKTSIQAAEDEEGKGEQDDAEFYLDMLEALFAAMRPFFSPQQ